MFEESKGWVLVLCVGFLIGLGYATHYFTIVDNANAALQDAKKTLSDSKEILEFRKELWGKVEKAGKAYQQALDQNAVLSRAKEVLEKRYRIVDSDFKYIIESTNTSVDKVRSKAVGAELGDITLTNGRVLRSVKIRKVTDAGISMIYADGIGSIAPELLTPEIQERFDLGVNTLLAEATSGQKQFLTDEVVTKTVVKQTPEPTPSKSVPSPSSTPPTDDAQDKIKMIKFRMAEIDAKIDASTKMSDECRKSASRHYQLAQAAKTKGQPSTRHALDGEAETTKANQLEIFIASLQAEKKKLEIELSELSKAR